MALPVSAADAAVSVSSATADPGDTVTVTVDLSGNPGVTVMRLKLEYDETVLTLTDVQDSERLGKSMHTNDASAMPFVLYWNNPTSKVNYRVNGTVATLTFAVAEDARYGDYEISLTCAANDVLNTYMEPVAFSAVAGTVSVSCDHARTDWQAKVPSTCLEMGVDALICRDCGKEMDTRKVALGPHAVEQWIIDKEATLTETGERHGYCTVCDRNVTEEIPKRVTSVDTTVQPDSATSPEIEEKDEVHITVDTDQAETLPGNATLVAKEVVLYGQDKKTFAQRLKAHDSVRTVAAIYDIGLVLEGKPYQPNEPVTVTVALSETLQKQYTDWRVASVNDESVTAVNATVENGVLTFQTTQMNGRYALLGKEIVTKTRVSLWPWIALTGGICLCAAAIAVVIYRYKRKKALK